MAESHGPRSPLNGTVGALLVHMLAGQVDLDLQVKSGSPE